MTAAAPPPPARNTYLNTVLRGFLWTLLQYHPTKVLLTHYAVSKHLDCGQLTMSGGQTEQQEAQGQSVKPKHDDGDFQQEKPQCSDLK